MATDRLAAVLAAVTELRDHPGSPIDHVCTAAVNLLALTGGGVSLIVNSTCWASAGAFGAQIAVLQELQLTLGEGPSFDAIRDGAPVMEADIARPATARWPAFAPAAEKAGLRAVFAFPLQFGAIRLGVLALYRDQPGDLSADLYAYGLVAADLASHMLLGHQAGVPSQTLHTLFAERETYWAEVHQATGMVSVQLDVSLEEAFLRLRAHAFSHDRSLRLLARDVVSRALRFTD